jgi:hypothetical protein
MCRGHSEARKVADRFMASYYSQSDVPEAVALSTGRARARLEYEVKLMKGAPPPKPEEQIHASFELRGEEFPTPTEARYFYRVFLGRPDDRALFARMVLVDSHGHWLVTAFDEKERNPKPAATDGTR